MAAVATRALSKRFEENRAVDGVDLVVGEGEVRGLLGPNGAGKTTLLRMLLGLVRPDGGTIELLGRSFAVDEQLDLTGVGGFVEEPSFYPYLSARANLEVLAELDGGGAKDRSRMPSSGSAWRGARPIASAVTRRGCAGALGSLRRCSERRGCCCWTSRRRAWTRGASVSSASWFASSPQAGSPCC